MAAHVIHLAFVKPIGTPSVHLRLQHAEIARRCAVALTLVLLLAGAGAGQNVVAEGLRQDWRKCLTNQCSLRC